MSHGEGAQVADTEAPSSGDEENRFAKLVEAAQNKRVAHLVAKLKAWHQGDGSPLTRAEIRELEEAGRPTIPEGHLRTREDVASAFGVTVRTVARWVADGMPKTPQGLFKIADIQAWREAKSSKSAVTQSAAEAADLEYRQLKTEKERISIASMRGELIPRDEVEQGRVARIVAVKNKLLGLGRQAAPILAGMDPREIEAWLNDWARDTLSSFAQDQTSVDRPD